MFYPNLHELFYHSSSSRRYFLSLPVSLQQQVGEYREYIHTAAQLRHTVFQLQKKHRAVALSESLYNNSTDNFST